MLHFRQWHAVLAYGLMAALAGSMPSSLSGQQVGRVMRQHDGANPAPAARSTPGDEASVRTVSKGAPTVTLTLTDVPRERALRMIAKSVGFDLLLSHDAVSLNGKVTLRFRNTPLDSAVQTVLRGTRVQGRVSLDARSVLLAPAADDSTRQAGPGQLRGEVVDSSSKHPIVNATVTLDGTNRRVVTDDKGTFRFADIEPGTYTITVRRLGYVPVRQRVTITADLEGAVRVVMNGAPTTLATVVTTGAGDRPRYQVGNSIAVINADSVVATQPVNNLSDLLANRAPGLQVLGTTGEVGAPSRFRVRGISSIQASNDPIFIIDGVRMNIGYSRCRETALLPNCYSSAARLDDLNPDVIESVEVLKGPAASTLFGSEAANGVIVIKTKRGKVGDTRTNIRLSQGYLYQPTAYPVTVQRLGQAPSVSDLNPCTLVQEAEGNCNPIDSVLAYNLLRDPNTTSLARGWNSAVNLDVSGGSSVTQYYLSGAYTNALGTAKLPAINEAIYERGGSPPISNDVRRPNAERNINANARLTSQLG
jgi:TonB-dependent SusC/RagA subfamily outer membrane receptor